MRASHPYAPRFSTCKYVALALAIVGTAASLWAFKLDLENGHARAGLGFLVAWSFWFILTVGTLFVVQIAYVIHAGWLIVVRRWWEHILAAFWPLACLFGLFVAFPFIFGDNVGAIWEWMNPDLRLAMGTGERVGQDPLFQGKSVFLNVPFFLARLVLYFAVFMVLSWALRTFSFKNDWARDGSLFDKARGVSSVGILLTALAGTFFVFDVYMSLNYHWFSTIYGLLFFSISIRLSLSFTLVVCNLLVWRGYLKGIYKEKHNYLLACCSLTFVAFWAYISFSQYFLIYNANIPEETFWYVLREIGSDGLKNSWWYVGLALIFGYFVVPFLALLMYKTKVNPWLISLVSLWGLAFGALDLYYHILPLPRLTDHGYAVIPFSIEWFDLAAFVGLGALLVFRMLQSAEQNALIALHDPRMAESLTNRV